MWKWDEMSKRVCWFLRNWCLDRSGGRILGCQGAGQQVNTEAPYTWCFEIERCSGQYFHNLEFSNQVTFSSCLYKWNIWWMLWFKIFIISIYIFISSAWLTFLRTFIVYPTIEYCHLPFEEHTVHPEHECQLCQSCQSWHHSCVTHFAESKACIYSMIEMAFWHFPVFCWIISIDKKMH